jgi:lipopolysaccharide biosynthesis glycosyltransferase
MFPEYDKAIYIDSDTCIVGDISELYNIDLKDNLFGGCTDISCENNEDFCMYFKYNTGVTIDKYINSGVLLMNMKKLREVEFESHFLYLLNKYHFDTVCPDQDYINAMAKGKILYLPNEWNAMPTNGVKVYKDPKIIHYNLFFKPWHIDNVDYEDYFWKYANLSPYKEKIHQVKDGYTKELQLNDWKTLDNMVVRTKEILKNKVNFKTVFENNLEKRI